MQMLLRDATLGDLPSILSIYNYAALNSTAVWTASAGIARRSECEPVSPAGYFSNGIYCWYSFGTDLR